MLDKLSCEVLVTIFSYLNYEDRKAVRQVCSNCRNAGYFSCLIKDEVLKIDMRLKRSHGESTLKAITELGRNFFHMEVTDIEQIDYYCITLQFGAHLKSLVINNSTLYFHDILHLFFNLPVVETFILDGGPICIDRNTIEPRINNKLRVKRFEVRNTNYLTDELLFKFWKLFPDLEHLALDNININCHVGVFRFNYSNINNLLLSPSGNVFTMQFLLKLIQTRPRFLKSLNFANTRITSDLTWSVMQNELVDLDVLNLNNCRELRPTSDAELLGIWQSSLKDLQLSSCEWAGPDSLARICMSVQCLKILNISHNKVLTDECLEHIKLLKSLEELDISFCIEFTSQGILNVLTCPDLVKTLKVLKLNGTKINDQDLGIILKEVSLRELYASYCNLLADNSLACVFKYQKNLRKLAVATIKATNICINGYCGNVEFQLPYFNFFKYGRDALLDPMMRSQLILEADEFYDLVKAISFKFAENLSDLPHLEYLNINRCPYLSDVLFGYPLYCQNMKELNLSGMRTITSLSVILLPYYFPNLENIDFTDTKIDDVGVCVLVLKLNKLKHLSLGNTPITNLSLHIIITYAKRLRTLNVQSCFDLHFGLLERLRNLPNIIEVVGTIRSRFSLEDTSPPPSPPSFS